eukprot:TRINITY_DN12856_c0_g1_i12.p1 TRINITY_DN12856_c0_g1~~TRINITY_DN12856_c0_g1_i12.p1  ORF type:complete len:232 (-),score=47.94 TRINITY_DN12856_c0_g1_i12:282-977(-)
MAVEKKPEPAAEAPKAEAKPEPKAQAKQAAQPAKPKEEAKPKPMTAEMPKTEGPRTGGSREIRRIPMSRLRDTAAKRLKEAQNTYAMLTTFNECDMSALTAMRKQMGPDFLDFHGVKLGFMSAFIKASVMSLQKFPALNAAIDGKDIVYHDYVDMSIAVSAPKGLVVPVLRNCESMSFAQMEKVALVSPLVDGRRGGQSAQGEDRPRGNGWRHLHHHQRRRLRLHDVHPHH